MQGHQVRHRHHARDGERVEFGLLVDAVSEVIDLASQATEAAPNFGTSVRRDFIYGIGKVGKRFVIIIEPGKALDVEEMADMLQSTRAAPSN